MGNAELQRYKGLGEMPAEATLGKVQQRDTAKSRPVRDRKDGKVR